MGEDGGTADELVGAGAEEVVVAVERANGLAAASECASSCRLKLKESERGMASCISTLCPEREWKSNFTISSFNAAGEVGSLAGFSVGASTGSSEGG